MKYARLMLRAGLSDLPWKRLLILAAIPLMFYSCMYAGAVHDRRAEQALLRMIDTELPDDANRVQVELFMRQHAQGEWGFDSHDHEFWGWLPQSQLDKVRMDRRVKITIEMNRGTDTVKRAYVETFFTFL